MNRRIVSFVPLRTVLPTGWQPRVHQPSLSCRIPFSLVLHRRFIGLPQANNTIPDVNAANEESRRRDEGWGSTAFKMFESALMTFASIAILGYALDGPCFHSSVNERLSLLGTTSQMLSFLYSCCLSMSDR